MTTSTAVAMFEQAGLPTTPNPSLTVALRGLANEVGSSGGVILKMDKTGHWVFGADQTEVDDGSEWAINPFSFTHGYIAWGDGEVLGEVVAPVSDPLPETGPVPAGCDKGWEKQIGFSVKCLTGDDADMDAKFSTTSVGGKKAAAVLAAAIAAQCDTDPSKPVPVVVLEKEHYQHKKFGRIYTPVFNIKRWIPLEGEAEAKEPEAAPAETGRRRQRT